MELADVGTDREDIHTKCGKQVDAGVCRLQIDMAIQGSQRIAQKISSDPVGHDALWVLQHLLIATKYKDTETVGHVVRVGRYAHRMWELATGSTCKAIFHAAQLHDIGKVGVPDAVLSKVGVLTSDEYTLMQEHTRIGAEILCGSLDNLIIKAQRIARSHHERWDGSGYPDGLVGENIPVEARFVMLADIYDALRMRRPYKPGFSHADAVRVILCGDGRTSPDHFDPDLLNVFATRHEDLEQIFRAGTDNGGN